MSLSIFHRAPLPTIVTSLSSTQSPPLLTDLPDLSVTAVTVEVPRPASTDSTHSIPIAKPGTPNMPPSLSPAPQTRNTGTPNSSCGTAHNSNETSVTNVFGSSNLAVSEDAAVPPMTDDYPGISVKITTVIPSVIDSEKSNSPGPQKNPGGNYPVRHLKKVSLD